MDHLHDLLLDGCHFFDLFLHLGSKHGLFFDDLHFMDLLSDIRHDLFHLLYLLLDDWLLLNLRDLLHSRHFLDNLHYLLHRNRDLHYPFDLLFHHEQLFDDLVAGDWHLERNDHGLFHLNDLFYFDGVRHYLFPSDFFGDFHPRLHYFLSHHVHRLDDFLMLDGRNDLLSDHFYLLVNRHFDVLYDLYLHYPLLDDRNLHLPYHLLNSLHFHYPIYDLLDDLRHFHNLLDYPRHHHDLLHDLLDLDHLGHFY